MSKLCCSWSFASNHTSDPDGRLIIIWQHPSTVNLLHQTRQTLTCEVAIPGNRPFIYIAVYAGNTRTERCDMWVELLNVYQALSLHLSPWMLGGDFNEITHHSEHSLREVNTVTPQMTEFIDCIRQIGVHDLRFQGPQYTWSNHQPEMPIAKKLDRQLVNSQFIAYYPNSTSYFLPSLTSDHTPCLTDLYHQLPVSGTKPFRFYNYLTKHPQFYQLVTEAWNEAGSMAVKLINLLLQAVQVPALETPTEDLFHEERDLLQRWLFIQTIEESYFRQKSRVNWLHEGDQNTTYFFQDFLNQNELQLHKILPAIFGGVHL
ncbi:BnaC08g08980D [Brassica napus]|uniref:BnaC08g08980D protein n=1 Tax=Brassica napus TaxID=3708 RepID=A0A078FHC5_BRANA|nr:BnaC08g08980D [Brassica napus]